MRKLAWLGMSTALLGCTVDDERTVQFQDLADRAVEVRELPRLAEVPVVTQSRADFDEEQQEEAAAIEQAELDEYAATWDRLGYFPLDTDLRPAIGDSTDLAAAFYDSDDKQITLIGSVPNDVLIHEHVHGLQDQHFDLDTFFEGAETSDALLAKRAVVEGDASLAAGRFVLEAQGRSLQQSVLKTDALRESEASFLDSNPIPLLLAPFALVYTRGLELCFDNLRAEAWSPVSDPAFSWKREDALFGELGPADTASVLAKEPVTPAEPFGLAEVPAGAAADVELVETDSVGAWLTYVLLRPVTDSIALGAQPLAFELRGDRVLFVRELAGEQRSGLVWASSWASETAAASMVEGMTALYAADLGADEAQPFLGIEKADDAVTDEMVWIEQRGAQVLVMRNLDAGLAANLAAEVWGDPAPEGGESADEGSSAKSSPSPHPHESSGRAEVAKRDRTLVRWTERLLGKRKHRSVPRQNLR